MEHSIDVLKRCAAILAGLNTALDWRLDADERLARIFYLWVVEEQRLAQIGQQVHLSTGRVSILIGQAAEILRDEPAILAWIDRPGSERAAGAPEDGDKKSSPRFVTHTS